MTNCSICLEETQNCICPECPNCGRSGNVDCYKEYTLQLNKEQLTKRYEYKVDLIKEQLETAEAELAAIQDRPECYTEPYKGVW